MRRNSSVRKDRRRKIKMAPAERRDLNRLIALRKVRLLSFRMKYHLMKIKEKSY